MARAGGQTPGVGTLQNDVSGNIAKISGYAGIVSGLGSIASTFETSRLNSIIAEHNANMARFESEITDIATAQQLDILKTTEVRILRDAAKDKSRFLRDTGKEEARLLKDSNKDLSRALGTARAGFGASGFSSASVTNIAVEQSILDEFGEAQERVINDFADAEVDMISDFSAGEQDLITDVAMESAVIRTRGNFANLRSEFTAQNIQLESDADKAALPSKILTSLSEIPQQKSFGSLFKERTGS